MKKKHLILGLLAVPFLIVSCVKNDDTTNNQDNKEQITSVSQIVKKLKDLPQEFNLVPTENDTIIGKEGVKIIIPANTLIDTAGNNYNKPVIAKLNEYLTPKSMILNNVQTSSDNQLLVTGGSFDLTFQGTDGYVLEAKPNSLRTDFAVKTTAKDSSNMTYFKGERKIVDNREVVNWIPGKGVESQIQEGIFSAFGIDVGLSNCDALYNMAAADPTQFEVTVTDATNYGDVTVWMYIKDFPSVIMITQKNADNTALKTYDNSIPKNLNAVLIAITTDAEGYLKFGKKDITVAGDDTFNVDVNFGTTDQLKALINSL